MGGGEYRDTYMREGVCGDGWRGIGTHTCIELNCQ